MAEGRATAGWRSGRLVRAGLRLALALGMAVLLWIVGMVGLASFGAPVSTLMLGRWIAGQGVDRMPVPLDRISPVLPRMVIASEDGRFCRHHGVDWGALREVIEEADGDGPSRGASTLAMQTAKNLLLLPTRSYIRKALEIPLALLLDAVWSKRHLMQVYLNIAEWGDGIFGVEAAAQHHFGVPAQALNARQASLLATALPAPLRRNPARPARGHQRLAALLRGRAAAADVSCLAAEGG